MSSWTTQNLIKQPEVVFTVTGAVSEDETPAPATVESAAVSREFLNRDPEYIVVELNTDEAGDIVLEDSADNISFSEVASSSVSAGTSVVRFKNAAARNICRISFRVSVDAVESGETALSITTTVDKVFVTWSP